MINVLTVDDLPKVKGEDLGKSPWFEVTQQRVDQFAEATNDYQYIHVDEEKASIGPMGGTIAHGFLTLSLLVYLNSQSASVPAFVETVINYGSDKVRYIAPVRVGKRIRSHQTVLEIFEKTAGHWVVKTAVTVEIEGEKKPALIAEILMMWILAEA